MTQRDALDTIRKLLRRVAILEAQVKSLQMSAPRGIPDLDAKHASRKNVDSAVLRTVGLFTGLTPIEEAEKLALESQQAARTNRTNGGDK